MSARRKVKGGALLVVVLGIALGLVASIMFSHFNLFGVIPGVFSLSLLCVGGVNVYKTDDL